MGKSLLIMISVLSFMACAPKGRDMGSAGKDGLKGDKGEIGATGAGCSVEQIDGGAIITCGDGTSALIACKHNHGHHHGHED